MEISVRLPVIYSPSLQFHSVLRRWASPTELVEGTDKYLYTTRAVALSTQVLAHSNVPETPVRQVVTPSHIKVISSPPAPCKIEHQWFDGAGVRTLGPGFAHNYMACDLLVAYNVSGVLQFTALRYGVTANVWITRSRSQCAYP